MQKLIITNDGSHSIQYAEGVTYHSTHGAIQESHHIFIQAGLEPLLSKADTQPISIFELGLGTGLNTLLTALTTNSHQIFYEAIEAFPLPPHIISQLNYPQQLPPPAESMLKNIHQSPWNTPHYISPNCQLLKSLAAWPDYTLSRPANLVYYDAFDPVTQPECWTTDVFISLFNQLAPGAILVTYCAKGAVRRSLLSAGFLIEKLPGPPGKREFLRARKPATSQISC